MKKFLTVIILRGLVFLPTLAHAQGAAPELFGIGEVVIDYAHFADVKTSGNCGITREQIADTLIKSFVGTTVPAVSVLDTKPPTMGVARIQLVPQISTYADENLDCVSWISLSAESRANAVIPPIPTLRSFTAVYWQQHTIASSSQTSHPQIVMDVLKKMADQFAQQYRLDQPPAVPK